MRRCLPAVVPAVVLVAAGAAAAADAPGAGWPDTPLGRAEAMAALQTFNAELLSHDSATLTLDAWCHAHRLAPEGASVVAERVRGADQPADAEVRAALGAAPGEPIGYRRVRLRCGDRVLSDADNWYLPGRLTPTMNDALDHSDVSFGRVVQPLHFRRHTLAARLLWSPLPEGWDTGGARAGADAAMPPAVPGRTLVLPDHLLEHRAVLTLPDGTPFSLVVERYTAAVLDVAPAR